MNDRCHGNIIRRPDRSVEYTQSYLIPAGHPDKALLEPCPHPILGIGAGRLGCGVYCEHHCGGSIEGWNASALGYGEDAGDDVRRHYDELPDAAVEAVKLAAHLKQRADAGE